MSIVRTFPFIGALVGIAAGALGAIGVFTDYWLKTDFRTHSGRLRQTQQ
jgi:uncharacterized membrane protein